MKLELRPTSNEDLKHLETCLAKDPFHGGQTVENWKGNTGELITFYDEKGPIFHTKMERVLRVHIQFDGSETRRNAITLSEGFKWLKETARKQGFTEIVFESVNPPLIEFCKKHFGFLPASNDFSVKL
jgi:hypothetical protein